MPITECIILAGGLGTRLRSAVPDLPKCMAPVAGRPFLHHVIYWLQQQGITHFIFSLGYRSEVITDYIQRQHPLIKASFSVEEEPLGTGGAIRLACQKALTPQVLVVNGDTMFSIAVADLEVLHTDRAAACTLALKAMQRFDRYGMVSIAPDGRITGFAEKKYYESGLINGGIYIIDKAALLKEPLPDKFSFEKEYLERLYPQGRLFGQMQDAYFIDIGIPEDFEKAGHDLGTASPERFVLPEWGIDKTWTLFLDRDGVINHEKHKDYIHHWDEFHFYDGVKEAVATFSQLFGRIVVVTNQKGVGKGLTKVEDLTLIHQNMLRELAAAGGHIDKVYFCADLEETSPNRKPNPGMGLQARQDFPEIDFKKSVMAGNTLSDMAFGRNLGVYTVFLTTTRPDVRLDDPSIDLACSSLAAFADLLRQNRQK